MLWNREDAEDATQEILVRVVTRLAQFDFCSKLKTWVSRVAVNYILDVKKSPVDARLRASRSLWPTSAAGSISDPTTFVCNDGAAINPYACYARNRITAPALVITPVTTTQPIAVSSVHAQQIRGAKFTPFTTGRRLLLDHQADVRARVIAFLQQNAAEARR